MNKNRIIFVLSGLKATIALEKPLPKRQLCKTGARGAISLQTPRGCYAILIHLYQSEKIPYHYVEVAEH